MRPLALAALILFAAAPAATAQEAPPQAAGPFILIQEDDDVLVLASVAERRTTAVGASATTVAFLSDGGMLLRGESVTEADCTRRVRRTGTIFVQAVTDPDVRGAHSLTAPGIDWAEPGPKDGPLMDFLCEGRHEPASPRVSTFVTPWLAGL